MMLPFPFGLFTDDDFPPHMKDILGNEPAKALSDLVETLENDGKGASLNKLKNARDLMKRIHAINAKLLKDDDDHRKSVIKDGEQVLEKINTLIYDAERNNN